MSHRYDQLLQVWELTASGRSNSLTMDEIVSKFMAMDPSVDAENLCGILLNEDLIKPTIHNTYELTAKGSKIRRALPQVSPNVRDDKRENDPEEWSQFRQLISYYIECVHQQERKQEILFSNQQYKDFIIPSLPVGWLPSLAEKSVKEIKISILEKGRAVANKLEIASREDSEIYIGYPVSVFHTKDGDLAFSPIGLIPVDLISFFQTQLELRLRLDEVEINQSWIEFNVPQYRRSSFVKSLYSISQAENRGLLDYANALPIIRSEIGENKSDEFNPDNRKLEIPTEINKKQYSLNVPLLFVGQPLKYSKTLKRELKYIRDKVSDSDLDKTALAYIFRKHRFEIKKNADETPIPFVPMNYEQSVAVREALEFPVSKVVGPPGTGKSHAAVAMIANLVYRGQSVLFTSKNHKAVSAIADNATRLMEGTQLDLITFCSNDDNSIQNPWYKQDIGLLLAKARLSFDTADRSSIEQVERAIKTYQRAYFKEVKRSQVLHEVEELCSSYESANTELITQSPIDIEDMTEDSFLQILENCMCLYDPDEHKFSFRGLLKYFRWRFCGGEKKSSTALAKLKEICPDLLIEYDGDYRGLREHAKILKTKHQEVQEKKKNLFQVKEEASDQFDRNLTIEQFKKAHSKFARFTKDALVYRVSERITQLEKSQDKIKDIMDVLRKSNSPYFFTKVNKDVLKQAQNGFFTFSEYFPAWATTLLSLTKSSPCLPGLFDKVIIDEAAQCEVPPIIPALFRAKTVTIIGDDKQLPPVIDLNDARNDYLNIKHGLFDDLNLLKFDYKTATAYNLVENQLVMLKEHFRCSPEIIDYCNHLFYRGELRVRSENKKKTFPSCLGYKAAVSWENVVDSRDNEIEKVRTILKRLVQNDYQGSIGIITPYHGYVRDLSNSLHEEISRLKENDIVVGTVHSFQGGERDLIIFVLGYTSNISNELKWFITDVQNRYIFNVAVSRAKVCLIIVGDQERCRNSNCKELAELAELPRVRKTQGPGNDFESPFEEKLYNALKERGIETTPQYPIAGRRLDLAYIDDHIKIDIEVDGVHYHTNSDGERKADDLFRDFQMESLGWKVARFWVYELDDDIGQAVEKVKNLINSSMS